MVHSGTTKRALKQRALEPHSSPEGGDSSNLEAPQNKLSPTRPNATTTTNLLPNLIWLPNKSIVSVGNVGVVVVFAVSLAVVASATLTAHT